MFDALFMINKNVADLFVARVDLLL